MRRGARCAVPPVFVLDLRPGAPYPEAELERGWCATPCLPTDPRGDAVPVVHPTRGGIMRATPAVLTVALALLISACAEQAPTVAGLSASRSGVPFASG